MGERYTADCLPIGRIELHQNYFGSKNQTIIWKRPFFIKYCAGSKFHAPEPAITKEGEEE
jgi:hypothetical protein